MNFNKCIAGSALFLTLLANSALAQNAKAGGNTSQAVLTIQVNVVPMITLPQPQAMTQTGAIAYNIPVKSTRNTVAEQTQQGFVVDESGKKQLRPVRVITVVAE